MTMIHGKNLVKKYGDTTAVNGTTFSIAEGEYYGFLGPNGAGKTTTVKMIHCFSPVTSGELTVNGMDVMKSPRKVKALMGVVPQELNLDPDLRVLKNLLVYARYFALPRKEARERAEELLDFFELTDKKDSLIRELSGGMKQRLLIARALINRPKILILDEPTTGLDPQARHMIWQRLRLLKKRGITMVLTTHYMEEAAQLCDRIAIMDKGKILIEGHPTTLVRDKIGKEVVEIRGDETMDQELISKLKGFDCSHERVGDTLYIFSRDGGELLRSLVASNYSRFLHRQASLEDLFLKLTGRELKE